MTLFAKILNILDDLYYLPGISSWQHPILFLRDVPFVDLYTILEFIYMGEVNVAQTDLTSFLKTAELLQIKGLAENANWNHDNPDNEDSLSGRVLTLSVLLRDYVLRDAFKKKKTPLWRDIVPTRGEGVKKPFEMSLLKIPFY